MIRSDADIKHGLAHIEIGEPAVVATMIQPRFSAEALARFFETLRNGHRTALETHAPDLRRVIGDQEHDELNDFGIYGMFAGRLAINGSGLEVIEQRLHGAHSPDLQLALRGSLVQAAGNLRA